MGFELKFKSVQSFDIVFQGLKDTQGLEEIRVIVKNWFPEQKDRKGSKDRRGLKVPSNEQKDSAKDVFNCFYNKKLKFSYCIITRI